MTKTCGCGCGQPTPLAKRNDSALGHTKGHPIRFIRGHHLRLLVPEKQPCTLDDCNTLQYARGWCLKHYRRWTRTGSPTVVRGNPVTAQPIRERLAERIDKDHRPGCWIWTGARTNKGYGTIAVSGRTRLVHRLMYELELGAIPDTLELDHLCRIRNCVNPAHLEPVTGAENTRRGVIARRAEQSR